ncbi:DUF1992 domain-containing protein [Ostreiculturibacter nitratireducens]|uniref:DUF1992 domain-containing protein n=1 Tax=Ostreiculturibacter nitratireducens TaxID=3075226 RepID=UPI0031B5A7EF
MSDWLNKIAERRMLKARAEGKLAGLSGEGKPLPERLGDAFVDTGEAVGFRIMAEAGALPDEIRLQKVVDAARARLSTLTDEAERKAAMADLAEAEMRLAIAKEARRKFLKG